MCTYFNGIQILESSALTHEYAHMLRQKWTVIKNQADALIHDKNTYSIKKGVCWCMGSGKISKHYS